MNLVAFVAIVVSLVRASLCHFQPNVAVLQIAVLSSASDDEFLHNFDYDDDDGDWLRFSAHSAFAQAVIVLMETRHQRVLCQISNFAVGVLVLTRSSAC